MAAFSKKTAGRSPQTRSRRAPVNTYYRAKSKSDGSPFVRKTPKRPVRKFVVGFLDVIILAVLLIALVYSLALKARPVVVANDFIYHSKSTYESAARVQFSSLRNRNKLTFDEASVARALQYQFPEISSVQVELPFFSETPVLHLSIDKPSFVLSSHTQSLIIDTGGVAVSPTASLRVAVLPSVTDDSGYMAKTGSQVMSSNSVSFIDDLIAQCRRAKIPIKSLTLPTEPMELQLRTKDTDYYVKFYLGGDVLQEAGQFLAARRHFDQTHQPPSQYLDVRVNGKIFYK